ncbi:hypothetical protein EDF60_2861 [Leucobacter luti]|uniref:DUF7341 domain-containing protein n=1 Tax=Leucobacter luti TaxID=340320 RepID=UPI00104A216A|nr:hypothetical protein [Leucobacter luti]MCW2289117.1 hypothetical protein [Leucobacter luti]TCK35486.1 hypothetical protein EDF60_2861 [Leucobacter luti]
MLTTDRAVERLTENHAVLLNGAEYECTALLVQLREAIASSTGMGSGGGSGDGGLMNLAALTLWDNIDGVARGWQQAFWAGHRGELAQVIRRLPKLIQAARVHNEIDDTLRGRLDALFDTWVTQIEDLFDPPRVQELTAPCPACGERTHQKVTTDERGAVIETIRMAAVIIPVKSGRALVAECRSCGMQWGTERDLIALAAGMGIEVDAAALQKLLAISN